MSWATVISSTSSVPRRGDRFAADAAGAWHWSAGAWTSGLGVGRVPRPNGAGRIDVASLVPHAEGITRYSTMVYSQRASSHGSWLLLWRQGKWLLRPPERVDDKADALAPDTQLRLNLIHLEAQGVQPLPNGIQRIPHAARERARLRLHLLRRHRIRSGTSGSARAGRGDISVAGGAARAATMVARHVRLAVAVAGKAECAAGRRWAGGGALGCRRCWG